MSLQLTKYNKHFANRIQIETTDKEIIIDYFGLTRIITLPTKKTKIQAKKESKMVEWCSQQSNVKLNAYRRLLSAKIKQLKLVNDGRRLPTLKRLESAFNIITEYQHNHTANRWSLKVIGQSIETIAQMSDDEVYYQRRGYHYETNIKRLTNEQLVNIELETMKLTKKTIYNS